MLCNVGCVGGKLQSMSAYRDPQGNNVPATPSECIVHRDARGIWWVRVGVKNHRVALHQSSEGRWEVHLDGTNDVWTRHGLREQLMERMGLEDSVAGASKELRAPMPGKVLEVLVSEGQGVSEGEPMLVLEAMKMENVLRAAGDGEVGSILVDAGQAVEKDAVLIALLD